MDCNYAEKVKVMSEPDQLEEDGPFPIYLQHGENCSSYKIQEGIKEETLVESHSHDDMDVGAGYEESTDSDYTEELSIKSEPAEEDSRFPECADYGENWLKYAMKEERKDNPSDSHSQDDTDMSTEKLKVGTEKSNTMQRKVFYILRQPTSEDEATRQQKKRVRVSKKGIPKYSWTEETELRMAELVKEHPPLYDKKHKEWLNVAAKNSRWDRVGEQLEPHATGPQCKKHYENMRTRVGKIMKKEKKSGASQPQRSARNDQIMEAWSFLTQHIVRGETVPSEQFAVPEPAAVTISDNDDDSGSQSQSPTNTGKGKGTGKQSRPPTIEIATTPADTGVTQSDLSNAVKQILSKADSLRDSHSYTGQQKIVHNFACLLEGHMQGIPEDSWHEFQIDCLNLVHRYTQRRQLFQQPWQPPQQQQF